MRKIVRCIVSFILFFSLLPPVAPVSAFDIFGINAAGGKMYGYSREATNVRWWPRSIIDGIESVQADLLLSVQSRNNWKLSREIVGSNDFYEDEKRVILWEDARDARIETGSDPNLDTSYVNAVDTIYSPETCNQSDAVKGSITTSTRTFVEGGTLSPYATNRLVLSGTPPTPDTKGAYAARFLLTTWDCPKELDVDETFDAPTQIPWHTITKKNIGSLATLFTDVYRKKRRALYVRRDLVGPDALKEFDRIASHSGRGRPGGCTLSDPSGDSTDLATKNNGSHKAADLKSATIRTTGKELTVTIETYGNLPETFAENDSLAFEIGFDRGGGSRNPLSPRDGVDLLFVVDVGRAINGYKETPGNQQTWTPQAVQKLPQGIRFSIPMQDIGNTVPPIRIFTSAVFGTSLDFDAMENQKVRSCTSL